MFTPRNKKARILFFKTFSFLLIFILTGCYSYKWANYNGTLLSEAPNAIKTYFDGSPNGIMTINAISPSEDYAFDAWEKDRVYAKDSLAMHFNTVELKLHNTMPEGTVIVDFTFMDGKGNKVIVSDFDLLRIVPKFNSNGQHLYPELLLEEFNRYGG
ncbi:hypothetical protein JCM19274_4904 [Algibacter lectus]|uniref:Uncharacterized protein n=1 Tax=Algibacter lectus TaxID=221126 RepID=A0A090WJL1_9FLAO|nr:hypothetical protein [Algibacter lectus]GAL77191.1 hypothetical protein JCM19274_4904 [Algibacter lectus]